MSQPDVDRNLLFGVIALQSDLVDTRQFADACTLWASRKSTALADVLVELGALDDEDRSHVEYLVQRKLKKHGNDVRATLAGARDDAKGILAGLDDDEVRRSMAPTLETTTGSPASTTIVGRIEQDRIRRKTLHSTGGIGHVWLAHDSVIDREVALKELRSDRADAANRDRFRREAKLTGRLEHPGIVPVHDFRESEDGTHCYYTMRFVRGRTLSEVVSDYHERRAAGEAATGDLLRLLDQFVSVCQTIAYAHSRRILHRDLKGENVVVGDFGEVVVLDWGLAKDLGDPQREPVDFAAETLVDGGEPFDESPAESVAQTMQGERLGTPAYMAPEQATGNVDEIDERTDVYGLAAILYEILTGVPPFDGKKVVEVLRRVVDERPTPPRERNPDVPEPLEAVCLRGLSKARTDRQRSATEIAEDVRSWIVERAERKRSEEERERFFALSPDLLGVVDAEGRVQQSNPAWSLLTGLDPETLTSTRLPELFDEETAAAMRTMIDGVVTTGESGSLETAFRPAAGENRWIDWSASRISGGSLVYLVGRDVTERRLEEQRFQGLLESAPDAMVVIDDTARIVFANGQAHRVFGYDDGEIVGQPIELLVPERFRDGHPAKVRSFLDDPNVRPMGAGLELFGRRRNGEEFAAEVSLSPVRTETGLLVGCAVRDVTDRRRAQRLCEALLESAPDAMIVTRADGVIHFVNSEATKLFGYESGDLIGQPIEMLVPDDVRDRHPELFAGYVADPHVRRMGGGKSLRGRHADRSEFEIEVSLSPIRTDDGLLISSAIRRKDEA